MRKFNEYLSELLEQNEIDISIFEKEQITYPYSLQARIATYLVGKKIISYKDYMDMYNEFKRRNPFLIAFEMPPRTFGESWLEKRILDLFPLENGKGLLKATKAQVVGGKRKVGAFPDYLDPLGKAFKSQFDFICYDESNRYKIEVKSCRANAKYNTTDDLFYSSSLISRAYTYAEAITENFQFHFQQLKPGFCDVFIFVGVCTDKILYWILTSDELISIGGLSPQHPTTGTKDVNNPTFEGQISKTIADYERYLVDEENILDAILEKFARKEE